MQLCNDLLLAGGGPALACTGCLVGLENHVGRAPGTLLDYALRGLEIVEGRGVDQALLLDLKRMLAVYPDTGRERRRVASHSTLASSPAPPFAPPFAPSRRNVQSASNAAPAAGERCRTHR